MKKSIVKAYRNKKKVGQILVETKMQPTRIIKLRAGFLSLL